MSELRASDADRERVAERLRTAAGEGRLTPEELEERLERAFSARTDAELEPLVADLPRPPRPPRARAGPRQPDLGTVRRRLADAGRDLGAHRRWATSGPIWPIARLGDRRSLDPG